MSASAQKSESEAAYLLLRKDATILEFSRNWESSVAGASDMHQWVGRNLFHLISGDATRMHIDSLLKRAIYLERPVSLDYRCDGGGLRRECRMHLAAAGKDSCRMHHEILLERPMKPVTLSLGQGESGQSFCLRCSMCCKVKVEAQWIEDPDMKRQGDIYFSRGLPCVFTVCEDCRTRARRLGI